MPVHRRDWHCQSLALARWCHWHWQRFRDTNLNLKPTTGSCFGPSQFALAASSGMSAPFPPNEMEEPRACSILFSGRFDAGAQKAH